MQAPALKKDARGNFPDMTMVAMYCRDWLDVSMLIRCPHATLDAQRQLLSKWARTGTRERVAENETAAGRQPHHRRRHQGRACTWNTSGAQKTQRDQTMSTNAHIGSSFDDFLQEEGLLEEVNAIAAKRIIAWQIAEAMKLSGITKTEMAARMNTSRASLNRVLDANDTGLTLETLSRAAAALGRRVRFELIAE